MGAWVIDNNRVLLTRDLRAPGESIRPLLWVGLNPSTADASTDDPTTRRIISFTKKFGYNFVVLINLSTICSPCPKRLREHNRLNVIEPAPLCEALARVIDSVVFCWGNVPPKLTESKCSIERLGINAYCLGKTRQGNPRHPLYLSRSTELTRV